MKRIGVVGYGRRMQHVLKNIVERAPDEIRVEAIFDTSDKAIARATQNELQVCRTVDELLGLDTIDWVFVGSFNAAHRDHAVAALEAGKNVFCEKPLATTKQGCLDVLNARRAHADQAFAVGFVLRYSAFYRTMKQWIDEGRVGDILSLEFNETVAPQHGAAMHGGWRRMSALAGSTMVEKCCHDIDIMHWMTNSRPARVASFGGLRFYKPENAHYNDEYGVGEEGYRYYDKGLATGFAVGEEQNITPFNNEKDVVDDQVAIMQLQTGAHVSFRLNMHSAQIERRFYIAGTRGSIRGDVISGDLEYTPVGWKSETETVRPIADALHGGGEEPMARDIVACMLEDKPMPTTVEDGVTASFTCLGIDEAMTTGTVVDMTSYWSAL